MAFLLFAGNANAKEAVRITTVGMNE